MKEKEEKKKLITIREIADDNTSISSTRWAFASVIKVDIAIIIITCLAGLAGHFLDKPLDTSFYSSVAMLLGVLTGIITTSKALQGFEPHKKEDSEGTQVEESK